MAYTASGIDNHLTARKTKPDNDGANVAHSNAVDVQRVERGCDGPEVGQEQGERQAGFQGGAGHWEVEPDVGGRLDGFSAWLDGLDLTYIHELLLTNGTDNKRARKELLALRLFFSSQAVWDEVRRPLNVSPQKILFAYLRQLEKDSADKAWLQLASEETPKKELRGLWDGNISSGASCGSGYFQQHFREHPDTLQALPRLLAHHSEKAWVDYCRENAVPSGWEEGISRVAHGVPNRVDRLKQLGNAVVPQVVEQIGRAIMEVDSNTFFGD